MPMPASGGTVGTSVRDVGVIYSQHTELSMPNTLRSLWSEWCAVKRTAPVLGDQVKKKKKTPEWEALSSFPNIRVFKYKRSPSLVVHDERCQTPTRLTHRVIQMNNGRQFDAILSTLYGRVPSGCCASRSTLGVQQTPCPPRRIRRETITGARGS